MLSRMNWRLELHRLDGSVDTASHYTERTYDRGEIVTELAGEEDKRWEVVEHHLQEDPPRMVWRELA